MKLWVKYIIGIILGIALSFAVSRGGAQAAEITGFISELCIRFGRYIVPPLVFFGVVVSVYKLRETGMTFKSFLLILSAIVASSLLLTVFSLIAARLIQLPRIPIPIETASETPPFNIKDVLRQLFPYSGFEVLINGAFLLPLFIFAGFAGAGCAVDTMASRPALSLCDSFSKVCYIVMEFCTDILSVGMIAIVCTWTLLFIQAGQTGAYMPLFLLLAGIFVSVTFGIYPLILHLLFRRQIKYPYRLLYASACPVLVAFFSGDSNFTLPFLMRHGKESLGIKRRINTVAYTVFSIFSRGGAAAVTTVTFIAILRSYSSLAISFSDIIWIGTVSFLLSFFLGAIPAGGPFIALTILCSFYGRGFETGFLLFKTAAPVICSFAAALDAVTAMFGSYAVSLRMKLTERKDIRQFI